MTCENSNSLAVDSTPALAGVIRRGMVLFAKANLLESKLAALSNEHLATHPTNCSIKSESDKKRKAGKQMFSLYRLPQHINFCKWDCWSLTSCHTYCQWKNKVSHIDFWQAQMLTSQRQVCCNEFVEWLPVIKQNEGQHVSFLRVMCTE